MSTNIKMIKMLILIATITLLATWCISINVETEWITLNSYFISNNMLLTLFGGVCSGLTAVLAEKVYKYLLDKNSTKNYLYVDVVMLYARFYFMHRDIDELLCNRNLPIPQNFFGCKLPIMYDRLHKVASTEYSVFNKNDKFMLKHNEFVITQFSKLKNWLDNSIYFNMAIINFEISQYKYKMNQSTDISVQEAKENIYKTMKIMDEYAKSAMNILSAYLDILQKESPEKFNWNQDKEKIENSYLGMYSSENLDEFLKQNLKENKKNTTKK